MKIAALTIDAVKDGLRKHDFSAEELTKQTLVFAEAENPKTNAYLLLSAERALQSARRVDEKLARCEDPGVLAGVPVAVKDVILTRNVRTTCGSKLLKDYVPPYGATAVTRLEARYSLPSGLVHSVMRQESGFRRDARSPAGAVGLMQLMPKTAERAARELALAHTPEQLTQVHHNLELGAYYLGKLLAMFDGRVVLGVAGYNAGPHAVGRWLQGADGLELDTWVARIPYGETRTYSEVAVAVGNPKAARAVARACATNPAPLVIPCQRVVREDGGLGGYRWGIERKEKLLAKERES